MPRSFRGGLLVVVIGIACCGSAATAQQDAIGPSDAPRAPDAVPPIPEVRELLATVNGTPIYADEIEPLPVAKEARPESPGSTGFERWLDATRRNSLQHRVAQLIQVRVVEEAGIAPSEAEIQAVRDFRHEQQQKRLEDLIRMRDSVEREVNLARVDGHEPPDEVLVQLRNLRQETALLEKTLKGRQPKDRDSARALEIAERKFAEDAVRSWKFTQLIFQKYGGKVLPMGGTIQPVEAYLQLFAEEQDAGRLKFETEWARASVIDAFEATRPQLVDAPPGAFQRPWWEAAPAAATPAKSDQ